MTKQGDLAEGPLGGAGLARVAAGLGQIVRNNCSGLSGHPPLRSICVFKMCLWVCLGLPAFFPVLSVSLGAKLSACTRAQKSISAQPLHPSTSPSDVRDQDMSHNQRGQCLAQRHTVRGGRTLAPGAQGRGGVTPTLPRARHAEQTTRPESR